MLPFLSEDDILNQIFNDDNDKLAALYGIGWYNNKQFKNWSTTGVTPIFSYAYVNPADSTYDTRRNSQSHHAEFCKSDIDVELICKVITEMKNYLMEKTIDNNFSVVINKQILKIISGDQYDDLIQKILNAQLEIVSIGTIVGINTYVDMNAADDHNLILMINGNSTYNLQTILAAYLGK